jgi:hypothetical protein
MMMLLMAVACCWAGGDNRLGETAFGTLALAAPGNEMCRVMLCCVSLMPRVHLLACASNAMTGGGKPLELSSSLIESSRAPICKKSLHGPAFRKHTRNYTAISSHPTPLHSLHTAYERPTWCSCAHWT